MTLDGKKRIWELLKEYEKSLEEYGLSYSTRLHSSGRARTIAIRHEQENKEYIDGGIVAEYFREVDERRYNGGISKDHYYMLRREAERFIFFVETGELRLPNPRLGPKQEILPEFKRIADAFLSEKMHPNTRNDARWVVHKYFAWLEYRGFYDLCEVEARQIQAFLLDCSSKLATNSIHNIKLYLSKLYSHLYKTGLSKSPYQALFSFKVNRESKMRPVMSREEIASVLDGINRDTVLGKRNYAVMILGVVLGLRACDVANLKFDDIDWRNGRIKILQMKTAKTVVLPLTKDVGEALKDYIINARPEVNYKHIFLSMFAPHQPLAAAVSIGNIFNACCKAVGLDFGSQFHILRRSLGTAMINTGTPVTTVSQVFGHADMDEAKKYIAVDKEHLKLCSLSFEGIKIEGGEKDE